MNYFLTISLLLIDKSKKHVYLKLRASFLTMGRNRRAKEALDVSLGQGLFAKGYFE